MVPLPLFSALIGPLLQVSSHLARLEGGGDLGPAPATAGLLGLLRDVMAGAGHSVVEDTREDLDTIIATVCDPLTQTLETTAAKLPRLVSLFFVGIQTMKHNCRYIFDWKGFDHYKYHLSLGRKNSITYMKF